LKLLGHVQEKKHVGDGAKDEADKTITMNNCWKK